MRAHEVAELLRGGRGPVGGLQQPERLHVEQPEEFNENVLAFLRRHLLP